MLTQEEIRAWMRSTPETDVGKQVVRRLQRELDDMRRMHLREPFPRGDADRYILGVAHRDFSS